MKNTAITILLLLTVTMLCAQSNYRPGYIITNDNDTVKGFIDFRTDEANAKVCKFKLSDTSKEQTYKPGEIAGFRYIEDGKYYVSRSFLIEGKQEKMFWEYLVEGILSLYYLEGKDVSYYIFEDGSGKTTVVSKKPDTPVTDSETGKTYLKPDYSYMGIIRNLFKDCAPVSKEVVAVKFNHPSLINLTKKYHDAVCETGEECILFETKEDKQAIKTQISLYAGMQRLSYKFLTRNPYGPTWLSLLESLDAAHCLSPVIGVQINSSSPRWQKSLSFQVDISLSQLRGKIQFPNYVDNEYFKYQSMIAQCKFGGKYTYPKGKIRPSIEAGMPLSFLFASSSVYRYEVASMPVQGMDNPLLPDPFMFGYYAGIGVDYQLKKDNFLLLRITFDNEFSFPNKMRALQFKLGYTF